MEFLLSLLVSAVAIVITAYVLPGIDVKGFDRALIAALLLALANAVVKPIMVILTLPITIVTLGLFLLVINALVVMLVSKLMTGFQIKSFGWAFVFAILLSLVNGVLGAIVM
jgi:putative membrane protein